MKGVGSMKMNRWIVTGAIVIGWLAGAGASPAAECTALWEFEETGGSPVEDTVASIDLVASNVVDLSVAGKFGSGPSGIGFDPDSGGESHLVTVDAAGRTATQQTGDFSILLWIRPTEYDVTYNDPAGSENDKKVTRLLDSSNLQNINFATSGYRVNLGDSDGQAEADEMGLQLQTSKIGAIPAKTYGHTRDIAAGTWHLLAVRYDTDGNATLNALAESDTVDAAFVTANSQAIAAAGAVAHDGSTETYVGIRGINPNPRTAYEGSMDDLAFFSGLLTDAEIATAFNSGVAAMGSSQGMVIIIQ